MTKDKNLHIGFLDYKKPFSVSIERDYENNTTEATIRLIGEVYPGYLDDALRQTAKMLGVETEDELPKPEKVIVNDPATIVLWSDGSKTVTKRKGCDEYDPMFGVMACALRKIGRNKVRIDAWEDVVTFLSDHIANADECRVMADMLNATADALECDGTMRDVLLHYHRKCEESDRADHDLDEGCQPLFHEEDGNVSVTVAGDDRRDGPSIASLLRELFEGDEL